MKQGYPEPDFDDEQGPYFKVILWPHPETERATPARPGAEGERRPDGGPPVKTGQRQDWTDDIEAAIAREKDEITRGDVMSDLGLEEKAAEYWIRKLRASGHLSESGKRGQSRLYRVGPAA